MRTLRHFYTGLAFSALLLTFNCTTSDSGDTLDDLAAADAGNQVVDVQKDEATDSEIPNPEQVAVESQQAAEAAGEAVDNNSGNNIQDMASDQQSGHKGPQLPEGNPDEASDYQMVQDQKTAQPVSDVEPTAASTDSLPSLSQVVAESDSAAPAPAAGKGKGKGKKGKAAAAAMAESDTGVSTTDSMAMDSSAPAADAAMGQETAPAKTHKSKARKTRSHAANHASADTLSGNFYIVQPGDTLGHISSIIFGTSRRWQDLASANSLSSNTPIYPGDVLRYPADSESSQFENAYKNLPRSKTTVQKGDTLSSIAERQMGSKDFWKLLWRWNEATVAEPNKIFEGQSLEFISAQELSALLSDRKGLKAAH